MFEFAWPWIFIIVPLPLLVHFLVPSAPDNSTPLKAPFFSSVARLSPEGTTGDRRLLKFIKSIAVILIWLLVVCAAARPQWVGDEVSMPVSGRDLLVAVDISGSMQIQDMVIKDEQIARLPVVKYIVGEFIERREGDRLGLVLFGSNAYLQSPLTFDRSTVKQLLNEAQIGFAGRETAIGDAIGLSIKRLEDRPADKRVLILLTDGANSAGEVQPRQAADLAKQAGVKIYTIGVGADSMVVNDPFFGRRNKNPSADLDEDTLIYIAQTTDGQYFRARSPEELNRIYGLLDELEPVEQETESYRPISALYMMPLGLALFISLLFALVYLLPDTLIPSLFKSSRTQSNARDKSHNSIKI